MSGDRHRRGQGWASAAIAGVAALAVVAGLALGGGPSQARKERRDDLRRTELRQVTGQVECLAADGRGMPAALTATPGCPGPWPERDPLTDAPYRFEPVDAQAYRLCADFELPAPAKAEPWEARDGDCITARLPAQRQPPG